MYISFIFIVYFFFLSFLYRYADCLDLYKDLIKNTQDDYEAERETNLSAVVACLSLEGKV